MAGRLPLSLIEARCPVTYSAYSPYIYSHIVPTYKRKEGLHRIENEIRATHMGGGREAGLGGL